MNAEPVMSQAEIRKKLQQIDLATEHLRLTLPLDSQHNQLIRVRDIADYLSIRRGALPDIIKEDIPARCPHACTHVSQCRIKWACRRFPDEWQRRLSNLLKVIETGEVAKRQVGDEWKLVPIPSSQAVPPARSSPHLLYIDLTPTGPRLRQR